VRQVGGDEAFELGDELVAALRRQIELEQFDRDQPLMRRVVGAKDRPQGSRTDLMKNSIRSERVRRRSASSVSVQ
jgi:hypothetical protein